MAIRQTAPNAVAATLNWDGDNGVGNLSFNNNWYGDSNPDNFSGWSYSNNLQFNYNNGGQTSLYWDYTGFGNYRNIGDISFESTYTAPGSAIVWDGNGGGLNFNQRFDNYSAVTVTVGSMNLSGGKNGASQIEFNPRSGNIVLNGNVYNDNSKPYHIYGNNGKTLTLNTALGVGGSPNSVSFTINQNSTVRVNANQIYGGATTITSGTLEATKLANGGTTSSIGLSSNAVGNLVINGGTLRYVGSGDSTDRLLTIGTGGATLDASGTGAISFAATGTYARSGTNTARTLVLTGTNIDDNVLGGIVADNGSGATSLTKSGVGRWVLGATNTFSGGTTINAGTLSVGANGRLGASTGGVTFNGGTLELTGNSFPLVSTRTITLNQTGTINTATPNRTYTVDGQVTGTAGLIKTGSSTLALTNSANNFTGAATINDGTLQAGVGTLVSASSITVNTGGTLLLSGTGRHIGNATGIALNGGTFNTGGLSEPNTGGQNIGALTLSSSSIIDLARAQASSPSPRAIRRPGWAL